MVSAKDGGKDPEGDNTYADHADSTAIKAPIKAQLVLIEPAQSHHQPKGDPDRPKTAQGLKDDFTK